MCGSFANINEKFLIRKLDPQLADYIEWLEDGVSRFGTPVAKKYSTWGGASSMSDLNEQAFIDSFASRNPDMEGLDKVEGFICGSECGPGTMRGESDF